jgi:hypothetical protein
MARTHGLARNLLVFFGSGVNQKIVRIQLMTEKRPPQPAKLSRPIHTERDYHEAKALLAGTMRSARSTEMALRAEALLREIVDYELRLDMQAEKAFWEPPGQDQRMLQGLCRRWSDSPAEGTP